MSICHGMTGNQGGIVPMKLLHTGDWHLGHHNTPTEHIYRNIIKYLLPKIKDVDLMIIAGDVFDTSISFNKDAASYVLDIFIKIFIECSKHNTILRVLKGTHYHDRNQLLTLQKLHNVNEFSNLDVKFISDMTYEYIDNLNLHMVYIQDDHNYSIETILKRLDKYLIDNNIQKFDYIITHGIFDIVNIPVSKNLFIYPYSTISKYVNKYILSGHIHNVMHYEQLIYCGSFDCLTHADDTNKGYWIIDNDKPLFVYNENPYPYLTLDLSNVNDADDITNKIRQYLQRTFKYVKPYGYLRIILSKDDASLEIRKLVRIYIKKNYHNINVTFKFIGDKTESLTLTDNNINEDNLPLETLSVPTISKYIFDRLKERHNLSTPETIKSILE